MSAVGAKDRLEAARLRNEGLTFRQIGQQLGVSHVTVQRWLKRLGNTAKGAAKTGEQDSLIPLPTVDESVDDEELERQLKHEKVVQLRLANQKTERELLPAGEVEATWANKLAALKTSLEALPARLKQRRPGLVAEDIEAARGLLAESIEDMIAA